MTVVQTSLNVVDLTVEAAALVASLLDDLELEITEQQSSKRPVKWTVALERADQLIRYQGDPREILAQYSVRFREGNDLGVGLLQMFRNLHIGLVESPDPR
jgi:hypothetical protein